MTQNPVFFVYNVIMVSIVYAIVLSQANQAHVSRKSHRSIHERVTRCVTRCSVTRGTVENLNTVQGTKYVRFTTINISKCDFSRKINKTFSYPVYPLQFLAISAVLSVLYHLRYSRSSTFITLVKSVQTSHQPTRAQSKNTIMKA